MTKQTIDALDPATRSEVFDELYPEYEDVRRKLRRRRHGKLARRAPQREAEREPRGAGAALLVAGGVGAFFLAREAMRRATQMDVRDKVVLITGGSRGLGLVLARQLADAGARLAICARTPHQLSEAQRELETRGVPVVAMPCDITKPEQVGEFVRVVQDRFGAVDVLINNAGVIQVGHADTMTLADYQEAMNINFYGALHLTLAVLPQMKRRGTGAIVNIVSIGGKISTPHLLPYSASKFALAGLSEGLRVALAEHGISVTSVYPGTMRTGSHVNAEFKGQHQKEAAWFSAAATTPGIALDAERAARQIIKALRQRRAQLVMPLVAELAVKAHHLAPSVSQSTLSLINQLLPDADGGIGHQSAKGYDSNADDANVERLLSGRSTAAENNQ